MNIVWHPKGWETGKASYPSHHLTTPPPLHSHGIVQFQNYTFARLTKSTVKIVLEEIYLNYKWD